MAENSVSYDGERSPQGTRVDETADFKFASGSSSSLTGTANTNAIGTTSLHSLRSII